MSFVITENSISNDSGKININDSMYIWPNKIFETEKFYYSDGVTFPKGKLIPVGYLSIINTNTSSSGSCVFDVTTGNISDASNVTVEKFIPSFLSKLNSVFSTTGKSRQIYWSCCKTRLTDATKLATEKATFLQGDSIQYSLYTTTQQSPLITTTPIEVKSAVSQFSETVNVNLKTSTTISVQNTSAVQAYVVFMIKVI